MQPKCECMITELPLEEPTEPSEPPSNITIITHGRCTDGFCAAWVARKVFPKAQIYFAHFGECPPDVTNKEVFMLDFSYKRSILLGMREKAKSLTVLDHHKTAQAELEGLPGCVFDMDKSGAGLAWHYFSHFNYPGYHNEFDEPMPWVVKYVQDRDLWKHELPETRAVNAVISSYPFNFQMWDELAHRSLDDVATEGQSILRYQEQVANDLVSYAREVVFDGHNVLAVNTSIMNSDVGCKLAKDRPFGIVWFQREDGKYIYSLRSLQNSNVDVSQIAKEHGGGGHRCSAGFVSDRLLV